ncbi:hypothetical protein IWQ57_000770, partial [Coemansia nantahalensis]
MIDAQDKKEEAAELAAQRARVSPTLPAYDSLLFHQLVLDNSPDPRRSQRLVDRLVVLRPAENPTIVKSRS